ncbi:MAG TPA: hypothetical protein VEC57_12470 [Candidatus Limnocylindrales bacterium]|nr:hypothetical protein [Candidatus Limnocylindrales bacterium]
MQQLPSWMRTALYATAVMNIVAGAALLTPQGRSLAGLPEAPPVFVLTVCLFVTLFGAGYLRTAMTGNDERMFIGLSAAGKLGFVAILVALWLAGHLPVQAPLAAGGDLLFGILFLRHLASS